MTIPILVKTVEEALKVADRMADPETKSIIYDAETTGLDWRKDVIVGHVVTFGPAPQDTFYIPVRHGEDLKTGNIVEHPGRYHHIFELEMQRAARRCDLRWVMHHGTFDMMMLHGHNINPVGRMEDTEVNDALLDEYASSHSLEAACMHAGTIAKKGDAIYKHLANKFGGNANRRSQMGNFWRLPGDDAIAFDYAAGDGVATWALWQRQQQACTEQNLDYMRDLESRVTRTVVRMMRRGVKIDEAKLAEVINTVNHKLSEAEKALPSGLNINSPSQLFEHFTKLGFLPDSFDRTPVRPKIIKGRVIPGETSGGNPSFDEAWLSRFPEGKPVLVVRKYKHLLNSFLLPLRDRHLYKGRVHATYHQMANDDFGTVTGRFSCSDPNLQQIHRRNKEIGKLIRQVFVPDGGLDWIDADLSQCEPRLLGHYSQAKVLLKGYLSRPFVDAHSSVAEAARIDRESGKRLNQTLITGGGKAKIIAMLGANGAEIYDAYFRALPEIKDLQRASSKKMESRGYVISLLGRIARLESRDKSYLAINRLLQCGNADIIKKAMVDIDQHFEDCGDVCGLLNTVHDALGMQGSMDFYAHRQQIEQALNFMTDFGPKDNPSGRQYSVFLSIPMVADYGVGKNWAEATYPSEKKIWE